MIAIILAVEIAVYPGIEFAFPSLHYEKELKICYKWVTYMKYVMAEKNIEYCLSIEKINKYYNL